jgi:hypothetical protein
MANEKDKYGVLMTMHNVAVTVPAEGDDYFSFEPSNTLGNGFVVPDRWLGTKLVVGHVLKLSHYVGPEHLGKKTCYGVVEIRERANKDGKGSVTLIACKEPKALEEATTKMVIGQATEEGKIDKSHQYILPGKMAVEFRAITKDKPAEATEAQPTTVA